MLSGDCDKCKEMDSKMPRTVSTYQTHLRMYVRSLKALDEISDDFQSTSG